MKDRLLKLLKFKTTISLIIISGLSLIMLFTRMAITDSYRFRFLMWNLFLAFVPWLVSVFLYISKNMKSFFIYSFIFIWLIFFPNAPYIMTDMIHLNSDPKVPVLFDFILLSGFAVSGLLFGFSSLLLIEKVLSEKIKPGIAGALSVFFIYLSALGIYIGRIIRWNSWDLFSNPGAVLSDTVHILMISAGKTGTWFFITGTGTLLTLLYLVFKIAGRKDFTGISAKKQEVKYNL